MHISLTFLHSCVACFKPKKISNTHMRTTNCHISALSILRGPFPRTLTPCGATSRASSLFPAHPNQAIRPPQHLEPSWARTRGSSISRICICMMDSTHRDSVRSSNGRPRKWHARVHARRKMIVAAFLGAASAGRHSW